jgi:tRNA1(Val) A37 N6-methylase TrmN6
MDMKTEIFISKEHKYGTDSILLAEFAAPAAKNKVAVDLCSGCGIIPVLLSAAKRVYAVEIQGEAAGLIAANIADFPQMQLVHGDLRCEQTLSVIGRERADLVTANPPYYLAGSGYERQSAAQKSARYEGDCGCNLAEVVAAANYLLKFGGRLMMCMTAPRLAETIGVMQGCGIEPKEIVLIGAQNSRKARLFLISGKKGAKSGVKTEWK